jgi:TIR domain
MADVFLSYSVKDRDAAYRIAALLEWTGWTVWWDQRLRAGTQWRSSIDEALGNSRCMVVLWSKNSISSQWVKEEAEQARQAGKLVPVRIDDTRPPIGFREIHYADLSDWDGSPHALAFRQMVLDLEATLGKPRAPVAKEVAERYRPPTANPDARAAAPARAVTIDAPDPARTLWHRPFGKGAAWLATSILLLVLAAALAVTSPTNWAGLFRASGLPPPPDVTQPPTEQEPPSTPFAGTPAVPSTPKPTPDPSPDKLKPPSGPSPDKRCADILQRAQLGEALSADDRAFLQRRC